jgi:hypothetical protein
MLIEAGKLPNKALHGIGVKLPRLPMSSLVSMK